MNAKNTSQRVQIGSKYLLQETGTESSCHLQRALHAIIPNGGRVVGVLISDSSDFLIHKHQTELFSGE